MGAQTERSKGYLHICLSLQHASVFTAGLHLDMYGNSLSEPEGIRYTRVQL
jgi:hypothetical protein